MHVNQTCKNEYQKFQLRQGIYQMETTSFVHPSAVDVADKSNIILSTSMLLTLWHSSYDVKKLPISWVLFVNGF